MLHENKHISFFLKLLYLLVFGVAGYLFVKYALSWVVPLLIAMLMSQIILKPVNFLESKTFLSRNVAAGICTLLSLTVIGTVFSFVIWRIFSEGAQFANSLPSLFESLPEKLDQAQLFFQSFIDKLPQQIANMPLLKPETWLSSIKLPSIDVGGVLSSVSWTARTVPTMLITTVFIFVSTFFLTSQRAEIILFFRKQLSDSNAQTMLRLKDFLYSSVFKWVKAQMIIISITFLELSVGFLLMKQPYVLFLAAGIAIIDALPILGVGTILIPWAVFCLITGNFTKAVCLCVLYAVVLIVRNSIEPRIVGGQIGLNPFVTLLCIYFGFRAAGFAGMFLLPVSVLTLSKLQEWKIIRIWK